MLTVHAYGATSATEPLGPMVIQRRDLRPHDVLIEIRFAGICHSDIHHARADWRDEIYPLVPGHEIAGMVTAVGPEVSRYLRSVGTRCPNAGDQGAVTWVPLCCESDRQWPAGATSGRAR